MKEAFGSDHTGCDAVVILSGIARPKVLLVVAHPAIGAALETLLRLEDRFDVRRISSLGQVHATPDGWRPDAALVDGLLLKDGPPARIGAPTLVLSGTAEDGQALGRRVDDGRGWLRKESTIDELVAAIDGLVGHSAASAPRRGIVPIAVLSVLALALLAAIAVVLWQALS